MMSSGEGTASSGTSSGSRKTRQELSNVRNKIHGELAFTNDSERKVTKRSHKLVTITAAMKASLQKYSEAFKEGDEVLLKGDERTYGSFTLTIPKEDIDSFFLVAVTDPTLVPPPNSNGASTSKVVDAFASNVSKRFDLSIKEVKEFLNKEKALKGLLEQSVDKFGHNPHDQGQIIPYTYDFGANHALYTDATIKDYQLKQFNSAAPERNDALHRVVDGLLKARCEDAYQKVNAHAPNLQHAVKQLLLRIWLMVDKSNDDLVSFLKAEEPLSTTMADDPSLAGRLSLFGAVEDEESEDEYTVVNLEPGTLLQFIALCLGKEESLVESEVIPGWTEEFATKYNEAKERVTKFNKEKKDNEMEHTVEHWPFEHEPLTPYDCAFITYVMNMVAEAKLDPRSDCIFRTSEVESFVKRVVRLKVEHDTARATATSSAEA